MAKGVATVLQHFSYCWYIEIGKMSKRRTCSAIKSLTIYIYIYIYCKTSIFRFIWGLRYHSFRVKISYCGKKKLNVISFVYCASGWKYENFCSCNVPFYLMFYIWTLLSQVYNAFSEGREFSRNLSLSIAIISRFFFASLRSKGCPFIT